MENAVHSADFKLEIGKTTHDKDRHHFHVWEFLLSSDLFKLKRSTILCIEPFYSFNRSSLPPYPPHSSLCHESCRRSRRTGAQFSRQNFGMVKNIL